MSNRKKNTRRPNGEGSVYQMKDGRFGTAFSLGKDENGKRLRHVETGKTEQEALDKMRLWLSRNGYLGEEKEEEAKLNGQNKVEEFVKEYKMKVLLHSDIKSRTYENYSNMFVPFTTFFDGRVMNDVDDDEIRRFFSYLSKAKENGKARYSYVTIGRIKWLLGKMFKRAVEKGYLQVNPMGGDEYSKPNKAKKKSAKINGLSKGELDRFMDVLKKHDVIFPVIYFMLNTGTRTQEALAIAWEDIDFANCRVHIHRALTKEVTFNDDAERISAKTIVGPTKSEEGVRWLGVTPEFISFMSQWRQKAPEVSKTKVGDKDFVFGNKKSPSWTCDGFRATVNRYIKNSDLDVNSMGLHRIRHTVATLLSMQDNANVFDIQQFLGHSDTRMAARYIDNQREEREKRNQKAMEHISQNWDWQKSWLQKEEE